MYLVLKLVGKQTSVITYSWSRYLIILDGLLHKLVENLKIESIKASGKDDDDLSEVEIEIDNSFFKRKFVPLVHQTLIVSL